MTPRRLFLVSLFGYAMGLLEAAVVVYLRLLYYPNGFTFPLAPMAREVLWMETVREAATLVMLVSVASLAGRTRWERFAWFCFLFGVWDVAYYAGLKWFLNWPASLLTWDILFLIPATWTGPVLAPLLVSLVLIVSALVLLTFEGRRIRIHATRWDWTLLGVVLAILLGCFMTNHGVVNAGEVPTRFPWLIFLLALGFGCAVFVKGILMNPRSRLARRYGLK